MSKPPFDPSKPFQVADKPPFDPSQPFQEDVSTDQPSGILNNAMGDIKNLAGGVKKLSELPGDLANDALDTLTAPKGSDFSESPISKDASNANQILYNAPKAIANRTNEIVTHPVKSFQEHPVNTALDVGSVIAPFLEGAELPNIASKAGKLSESLADFSGEHAAKAAGFGKAAFAPEEIAKTRAIGKLLKDENIVGTFNSSQDMFDRLLEAKKKAAGDISSPLETLDASGIKASSGNEIGDLITSKLFDEYFKNLPTDVVEKLKAGIPTGSNYDLIADKIRKAAANASTYGDNPLSFDTERNLKQFQQGVGNFDSEARALQIPKKASSIIRSDLEGNVKTGSDLLGNPDLADQFTEANRKYHLLSEADDPLSKQIGKEETANPFGVSDAATTMVGHAMGGNPGAAAAYAVKKGFFGQQGNQLAASASKWIGGMIPKILKTNPSALGIYGPLLMTAQSEGGDGALAVRDHVLQNTDPEYRQTIRKLQDQQAQ